MGISVSDAGYRINGVLSTDKTCLQNIETLCSAARSWLTYDVNEGKWAIVINENTLPIATFADDNIIGPITVGSTGINELYNSVNVTFPHIDLNDEPDVVTLEIPEGDLFDNEPDNILNIQYDCLNDPVQAAALGLIELKQSRMNVTISFRTDFSQMGLRAGDVIEVYNSALGWSAKLFRIISISDSDEADGSIALDITALEFDATMYDTSDLTRYDINNTTGIATIGSLATPGTPTLNVFQQDTRPRITVTATIPTGIVNTMELYLSSDGTNYSLIQTYDSPTGTFTSGTTVLFDYDQNVPANVYVKVRALNATTSSAYSAVASYTGFASTQVTQAAKQDAPLVDNSGNLLTALALSKVAGWAFAKSPTYATAGTGILAQLGLPLNDFNTSTGAPVNAPGFGISSQLVSSALTTSGINAIAGTATLAGFQYPSYNSGVAFSMSFSVTYGGTAIQFQCESPSGSMDYQYIDGVTGNNYIMTGVIMYFPVSLTIKQNGTVRSSSTVDWQTQGVVVTLTPSQVGGDIVGTWEIVYSPLPTYDLNMRNVQGAGTSPNIYPYNFAANRGTRVFTVVYQ